VIATYTNNLLYKSCIAFPTGKATHFRFGKQTEPGKCQSKYDKLSPREAWSGSWYLFFNFGGPCHNWNGWI